MSPQQWEPSEHSGYGGLGSCDTKQSKKSEISGKTESYPVWGGNQTPLLLAEQNERLLENWIITISYIAERPWFSFQLLNCEHPAMKCMNNLNTYNIKMC